MCSKHCPVLALPGFHLDFCIDADASSLGVGPVLHQQEHPITFFCKALGMRHQSLFIYEKETSAALLAVKKWHPYLVGRRFRIRTDRQSLRFLSDQHAITPFQQKWVANTNVVVDALSRQPSSLEGQLLQMVGSSVISRLFTQCSFLGRMIPSSASYVSSSNTDPPLLLSTHGMVDS